jgi:hypothetical protein
VQEGKTQIRDRLFTSFPKLKVHSKEGIVELLLLPHFRDVVSRLETLEVSFEPQVGITDCGLLLLEIEV